MSSAISSASTIQSLYLAFYGRPADASGLKFWTEQLDRVGGDIAAIVPFFTKSPEAETRFPDETTPEQIARIYQQLFNREPDADGLAFWVGAVENGHVAPADLSATILQYAHGSDYDLSQLRREAAEAFTAAVEASGSAYDGYAAIEAARVLVRAVTLDTKPADMASLVNAAVAFVDIAAKTPSVVTAIASGGPLLEMFDTPRGLAEPVALLQTLADTAKAAAGNPVTLESLLRGGGMTKVLQVMPAAATLQDVADALVKGGLPAAVEVVYPTAPAGPTEPPAPPAPAFKLSFASVTQGEGDSVPTDNVTKVQSVEVKFSYTGNDLASGQRFQASFDGQQWFDTDVVPDARTNTVVVKNVDLSLGLPLGGLVPQIPSLEASPRLDLDINPHADLATTVYLRAVNAAGATIDSVSQQIIHDRYVAAPKVELANDSAAEHTGAPFDRVTSDGSIIVSGIEAGAKVEYMSVVAPVLDDLPQSSANNFNVAFDPNAGSGGSTGSVGNWTTVKPTAQEGFNTYYVRQTDAAGNVNQTQFNFRLDTKAPAAPVVTLVQDANAPIGGGTTTAGKIQITGLETTLSTVWEYQVDGGEWLLSKPNNGTGTDELELSLLGEGEHVVLVRQVDAAGNLGKASPPLRFTVDRTAAPEPAFVIGFEGISQGLNDRNPTDNVTNVRVADIKFSYTGNDLEAEGRFEASFDGIDWFTTGIVVDTQANTVVVKEVNLDRKLAGQVESDFDVMSDFHLRALDKDGKAIASFVQQIVYDHHVGAPVLKLVNDTSGEHVGTSHDGITAEGAIDVSGIEAGAKVEYLVVPQASDDQPQSSMGTPTSGALAGIWSVDKPTAVEGLNTYLVRQTDVAGNVSESQISFTLDTRAPEAPLAFLVQDTGILPDDGITTVGAIRIVGLEKDVTTVWEYRIDGGEWLLGQASDGTGSAILQLPGALEGGHAVQVRQVDAAGNESKASEPLTVTLDTKAPSAVLSFNSVDGASGSGSGITNMVNPGVYFTVAGKLESGEFIEWRLQGSEKWTALGDDAFRDFYGTTVVTPGQIDLSASDPTIEMRISDAAGNHTLPVAQKIDGPYQAVPFTATATADGVRIHSTVAGDVFLDGGLTFDAVTTEPDGHAIVGTTLLGAQQQQMVGKVALFVGMDVGYVFDSVDNVYALGTNGFDTLTGRTHAWGFDGKDVLIGTSGADFLVGGKGGDIIDVGVDAASDTIVIRAGETQTGLRADGNIGLADRLINVGLGDMIQTGAVFSEQPVVGNEYLTSETANRVAIVRGTLSDDEFVADNSGAAVSYMVQWSANGVVHSIVLDTYGTAAPALEFDIEKGVMTLVAPQLPPAPPPVASDLGAIEYHLAGNGLPAMIVKGATANVVGFGDAGTLSLVIDHDGTAIPVNSGMFGAPNFGMTGDTLTFNTAPAMNVYSMGWTAATFKTDGGFLQAGSQLFAGGRDGYFQHSGFKLDQVVHLDSPGDRSPMQAVNEVFFAHGASSAKIETGAGKDVVFAISSSVTVSYQDFQQSSEDLVLNFGSDDLISIEGVAARAIDDNGNGRIDWWWEDYQVSIDSGYEGVCVLVDDLVLAGSEMDMMQTAETLNRVVDVSGINAGDEMLILARDLSGKAGALLQFVNGNNDGFIDASELTMIAMFTGGLPGQGDIVLVGTQQETTLIP